jgi:bifunctional DNA-binding transcriptional regulator/antitoxin component of YhaV-PrlF toxin-antitoxin module
MTVTVKNRKPLVVPLAVRKRAGLKSGQELEFKVSGGVITILPKIPAAGDDYTPEQRRIIDACLDKADEDIKAGQVHGPFSTHREFIASLHQEAKKLSKRRTKRSV